MKLYYFSIFILSFMMSDLNAFPLFKVGQQNFYGSDLFFCMAIFITVLMVVKERLLLLKALLPLNLLLLGVFFAIIYGLMKYRMSAIGEGRMIYKFFYLSVPFFLDAVYRFDKTRLIKVINNTILCCGGAAFLMLMIEMINGGRFFFYSGNIETLSGFEDFRGIRYLDADANFSLDFLAFYFLTIALYKGKKVDFLFLGLSIFLLIIIILIKNRSALAALSFAFVLYFIFQASFKLIFRTAFVMALLFFLLANLLPAATISELVVSYRGIFDISADETGSWRMLVQYVAFNEALRTPFLGQGFGGYFNFYIPELDMSFEYPPHNMFVLLFLKGGIFCLLLAIVCLVYLARKFYKLSKLQNVDSNVRILFAVFTILCLSQFFYGMVYDFYQFFFLLSGFMILLVKKIRNEHAVKETDRHLQN